MTKSESFVEHYGVGKETMKKLLSNKQRKTAVKLFPKTKRNEHMFSAKDYELLSKR